METKCKTFDTPNSNGSVWPNSICPAYTQRDGAIESMKGCWYCKYADFHLKEEKALDVGVCNWPNKIFK